MDWTRMLQHIPAANVATLALAIAACSALTPSLHPEGTRRDAEQAAGIHFGMSPETGVAMGERIGAMAAEKHQLLAH